MYLWKVWKRPSIVKLSEADLISGRRELNLREEREKEELERQTWGPFKRYNFPILIASDILVFTAFFVSRVILRRVSLCVVSIIDVYIRLFVFTIFMRMDERYKSLLTINYDCP